MLPEHCRRLPLELGRVDAYLDDGRFFAPFRRFFDSRDRGRRDGIRWAKEHATAGELEQLASLDGSVLAVGRPHTLASFISATGDAFHQVVKIDAEDPYWDGFRAGAGDVWEAVAPLLHRPVQ
jgi:hypothetical protein